MHRRKLVSLFARFFSLSLSDSISACMRLVHTILCLLLERSFSFFSIALNSFGIHERCVCASILWSFLPQRSQEHRVRGSPWAVFEFSAILCAMPWLQAEMLILAMSAWGARLARPALSLFGRLTKEKNRVKVIDVHSRVRNSYVVIHKWQSMNCIACTLIEMWNRKNMKNKLHSSAWDTHKTDEKWTFLWCGCGVCNDDIRQSRKAHEIQILSTHGQCVNNNNRFDELRRQHWNNEMISKIKWTDAFNHRHKIYIRDVDTFLKQLTLLTNDILKIEMAGHVCVVRVTLGHRSSNGTRYRID